MTEDIFHKLAKTYTGEEIRSYIQSISSEYQDNANALVANYINKRNHQKYTPLHSAIFARNLEAVEVFLENGADLNAKCHGTVFNI